MALFHRDIGFPEGVEQPAIGLILAYSRHAEDKAFTCGVANLPPYLPEIFDVVEVEVINGRVSKWVVRMPWTATSDLVLVIVPDGWVKTVWVNRTTDLHATLDRSRYDVPEGSLV